MGAPALALVTDRSERFRLTWRGYDRAEVDAFLSRTAADRQRLQADLAQLEAALADHDVTRHREMQRLGALRHELAHCLETSIDALHIANLLLASPMRHDDAQEQPGTSYPAPASPLQRSTSSRSPIRDASPLPAWLSPARTLTMVGVLSASAALLTALANGSRPDRFVPEVATPPISGTAIPDASWPAAVSVPIAAPLPAGTAESVVEPAPVVEGLVLTLTALSDCWVRTTIDGGEPRERLLRPNESITLRASGEAVLRIGDPAALALQINGRPAKALGEPGRVVTARITPSNYLDMLSGN